MHIPVIIFLVVVCLMVFAISVAKTGKRASGDSGRVDAYYLRDSIFSPAERSFYGVLESLGYESVTIACKIRLADVFGVKKGLGPAERQRAQNRVQSKHIDFMLLRQSDGRPLLGIELDDGSHGREDRRDRDTFVDGIFSAAGLPILHVPVKPSYDPKEIHRLIDEAISKEAHL